MKRIYESPQTEAMPIQVTVTLCASGDTGDTVTFGSGKATGEGL